MKSKFFSPIKALILDMDGVLWRGDHPLGDLPAIFEEIQMRGFGVVLATNNAALSVCRYLEKLSGFGVGLESWQIINSSQATVSYLCKVYPSGGPVYIIGEDGLIQTLAESGFFPAEKDVLAVVVGIDRGLTYEKLSQATRLIRGGAAFIGTNSDRTYPVQGALDPGAGAILAALEAASESKPLVIGKPSPEMYRLALERLGATPDETLVVCDRLETDMSGAQALGCRTALVLSGVSSEVDALAWRPAIDWIAKDLTSLLHDL